MIQARMDRHDKRLYSPTRDVAHNFGFIVQEVARRLERAEHWPVLKQFLTDRAVGHEQLGETCASFCRWVRSATEVPDENMEQALNRCDWDKTREEAHFAFLAVLGCAVAGVYFKGVRDAMLGSPSPTLEYKDLCAAGERARRLFTMPPWRRRLSSFYWRLVSAWSVLTGKG